MPRHLKDHPCGFLRHISADEAFDFVFSGLWKRRDAEVICLFDAIYELDTLAAAIVETGVELMKKESKDMMRGNNEEE